MPDVCGEWLWTNDSVNDELKFRIDRHEDGYVISSGAFGPVPIVFSRVASKKKRFLMQIQGENRQGPGQCYYYAYIELATSKLHLWNIDQEKLRSPKWINHYRLIETYGTLYEMAGCSTTLLLSGVNTTGLARFITDNFEKLRDYSHVTYTKMP